MSTFPGVRTGDPAKAMALFDLATDPAEQHNVAADHPDTVAHLKALFDALAKEVPAGPIAQ